ncbi:MAG: leucine-rich repeat domain-containing protein [Paludibacteraceae bacterium]|nr:leucine-rich repeat domain-containing protein [Paludibacteraceae bacterium]
MKLIFHERIFRILFVLLLTICSACGVLPAKNHGVCGDNVKWTLTDGVLTFSGSGQMKDFGGFRPWHERSVKTVVIEEGITNIGRRVFEDCKNLTQVSIPNTVLTIGDSAFYNCVDLKRIVIPNSVKAIGNGCFSECESLDSIVLSDHLQRIGFRAFYQCKSLAYIIIPNSVRHVGSNIFQECGELTILVVPDEPFEVIGKDTLLRLEGCPKLSIVRAHHSLCPDYMLKYIPPYCPFMREGNPRRYYTGSISKDSVIIVPALRTYTLREAKDTIENIFNRYFSVSNPCASYSVTEEHISRFIINLERLVYKELLRHYYDKFYEAGSNNDLDAATTSAFKHVMLGGKEDEELMWEMILTKYGSDNATNNIRFLMDKFREISDIKDSVYQHTIDSITNVYYDVLYPSSLREMCGYWVSVNDTAKDGSLTDTPEYIINITDITFPNGTTILSAPECDWSAKKRRGKWQNKSYDDSQLRYSYETGYNEETQTLRLLFSSQSKKIANAKLQHQALDMVQNLEATMSASVEQFQKELNKGLANNWIGFGSWSANSTMAFGIGLGIQVLAAVTAFAIIYSSNIETAQKYEIRLTPQAPKVLDASVKYAYARHNYNNEKTKQTEEIKKLTFVKWEETDSVIFITNNGKPVFIGEELPTDSPLITKYNANNRRSGLTFQEINKSAMGRLRQKAEEMLLLKERKESSDKERSNEEEGKEELFFY